MSRKSIREIKPVVHKSSNFKHAEEWDISQHIQMTPEERQEAAKKLKERVFGKNPPEVKDSTKRRNA
jgi:hypothetical protein